MKIQMVDLKGQYEKIKSEIDTGIQEVINQTAFIKGPQVKQFEDALANYLNVKHVISCGNGTDAIQIALMALNLKPGDEIIIPAFSYVATAEAIVLLGLKPVMIDVDQNTFNIDPFLIENKISPKTKAIMVVHLFGQCANMELISALAIKHKLFVIEDTAQALGSRYTFKNKITQSAGCIGNIGTTSFFPSKNLGCYGDGGALMTNDDGLAMKIKMIANHGQKVQYEHECIGVNSRLDTIQAAVLLAKLPHLHAYENARQEVAKIYDALLSNYPAIEIPEKDPQSTHVYHQYVIRLNPKFTLERDDLKKKLAEQGIPSMVYYPMPLHHQKAFAYMGLSDTDFKVSLNLCRNVLALPIHTEMTIEMATIIANTVITIMNDKIKNRN